MIKFTLNFVRGWAVTVEYCAIETPGTAGGCEGESFIVTSDVGAKFNSNSIGPDKKIVQLGWESSDIFNRYFSLQAARTIAQACRAR